MKRINPWPWAIIATFVLFLSGTLTLVVVACSHHLDLVSPDYYEQEIRFQNHLNRVRNTSELKRAVAIRLDPATRRLLIALPTEQTGKVTTGQVHLYRPSSAGLDQKIALNTNPSGEQSLDASHLLPGHWKVRVTWTCDGRDYFTEQSIMLQKPL